jgi:hypothetical protein
MGLVMDLVAGQERDILVAVATDNLAAFDDGRRFAAHLTFGGIVDPTWLDLFSQAVRSVTGRDNPVDFLEARTELEGPSAEGAVRTVELIHPAWITALAMLDDRDLDAVTGHWIDLLEDELGDLPREEKPSVRKFAHEIVSFARSADRAPAVILAWSL